MSGVSPGRRAGAAAAADADAAADATAYTGASTGAEAHAIAIAHAEAGAGIGLDADPAFGADAAGRAAAGGAPSGPDARPPAAGVHRPVLLSARSLGVELGGRRVVDAVSASLHGGEWIAIVGPNGAGKSSLLAALAGLIAPCAGDVLLEGRPLARWPHRERARRVAWLGQHGEAEGEIAARDVVRLGRLPHHGLFGAPTAGDEAAVDRAMAETESSAFASRRLSELSGGERQRVLLARALAVEAPVLLLDEPTTHLDAPHQRALLRGVERRARAGAACALVLHDLTLALGADRVWLMHQGRLVAAARPDDPALHRSLLEVFDHAVAIERLTVDGGVQHVARPVR